MVARACERARLERGCGRAGEEACARRTEWVVLSLFDFGRCFTLCMGNSFDLQGLRPLSLGFDLASCHLLAVASATARTDGRSDRRRGLEGDVRVSLGECPFMI